jgi:tRNA U34 5-carboxymethylaminomethyl modifying GTPase MnmE/TrmE
MNGVLFSVMTANTPGAVGIIQVYGNGAATCVEQLCGVRPNAHCRLARFGDIDEGMVVGLRDDWCQIMPHGGVRVVQRLCDALEALGAQPGEALDPRATFPEATTELEAEMLSTLARAASPAAIPLLLAQRERWEQVQQVDKRAMAAISEQLDRLVNPATVAVVGRANVGKSTLTNLVMGRAASLVADLPGTTRDWVAGMAQIAMPVGEVVVRWCDTPGMRRSDDTIEQRAIELARRVVAEADVLIAMRDVQTDWPAGR